MKTQALTRQLVESHGQYAVVIYGRNANSNYPLLRLDYAVLATGGTGFIMWWDGGFNQDSTKCYIVDMDMNPFDMIDRAVPLCSQIIVTVAAIDEIERRGDASRLEAIQAKSFDSENVSETTGNFGVHGYVVWGRDTNLEVPGCVIDYGSGPSGESFECFHRVNIINQNMKQLLLARNDDPIALLRAARKRHSYVVITLRAMSVMQNRGLDLSSIRESTNPSEKRGVRSVREAARTLRIGCGNINEARDTLMRYGFTPESLSEITMSRTSSTASLIARIDRLCEISTGAIVWASKHTEAFPESRNKIGGSKGKYKARKVGQYGAKSLVNESGGDWAIFVKYMGGGSGPYDVVSRHPTQADAEQQLKREISQRKLKHPDTFKDAWVAMHPDAAMRDHKKRKGVNEGQVPSEDQSDDEIYDDCRGYCRNATDRQLRNIYADEKQRARRNPGEVGRVAKIFARAAKDEMEERGIDESSTSEGRCWNGYKPAKGKKAYSKGSCIKESDDAASMKALYAAHARKLLQSSEAATDSRHGSSFGLGYRSYLKTILRGNNPNDFKPKGDHLTGWTQARKDLVSFGSMTEARKDPTKYKQSSRPGHSVRSADIPRIMLARQVDPEKVSADDHDAALNYLTQTLSPGQLRTNSKVSYQQAKAYWTKGDKTGAMSRHWWGSMYAKAAGDSFIPASSLFSESTTVSEALPTGVKVVKHKSLSGGSAQHQVLVNGRSIGDFYAGRDEKGAFYTTHTDMRGRVVKAGEVLRDRDAMIQAMLAGDKAEAESDFAKKKASPNRVEMKGDKVVAVYVGGKPVVDHGVKIDSKADIRRGAVFDLEDKYSVEFAIVSESVVNEVAGYKLRDSDKKVVKAWVQQKAAEGRSVISDGTTLRTTSLGAADMAKWINGKPHIGIAYGNTTQTLINFIRKELRDQGMTTLGKLTPKGEPVSDESQPYRTINDAGKKIPDLREGTTEVWFSKARTLDENAIRSATLPDTHVLVGKVKCDSPSRLFVLLQEEKWSPHGEATYMLRARGVIHSSMTVGDVIVTGGRHYMVAEHGFKRLDK